MKFYPCLSHRLAIAVILSCVVAATQLTAPAQAQIIVVGSSGQIAQSYPIYTVIPEGERIRMERFDSLSVLAGDLYIPYRGMGDIQAGQAVQRPPTRPLAPVPPNARRANTTFDSVRRIPRPAPADIDLSDMHRFCTWPDAEVRLRRAGYGGPTTVTVTDPALEETFSIDFENDMIAAALPQDFNVRLRRRMSFTEPGQILPRVIEIVPIPLDSDNMTLAEQAILLADNRCFRQIDGLVEIAVRSQRP